MTPGARRAALWTWAACGFVTLFVGVFWLTADVVAHLVEAPRG